MLYNCFRLGRRLNFESHYNSNTNKEYTIERDLKKLHRGWGKHRIEEETCTTFCKRLGKVVQYQKGKPKYKEH